MAKIEESLAVPVQLTDSLRRLATEADSYRQECAELKAKAESIAHLLRSVARFSSDGLYRRPLRRIMQELEKSLGKALILVRKCKRNGVIKRVITITSANDFKRANCLLDNAIADISWLLSISGSGGNTVELNGLPPIASSEPMMSLFWEQIALLQRGTDEETEEAANSLGLLARDNGKFARIIVEEGAVVPMLKVLADGTPKAREAAARALGHMAKDADVVKQMIEDGIAPVFVKLLVSAPMKVQAAAACTLADILTLYPAAQDLFLEQLAIRPLVGLLGEFLEEPGKAPPVVTMHTLVASMTAHKNGIYAPKVQLLSQNTGQLRTPTEHKTPLPHSPLKPGSSTGTKEPAEKRNATVAARSKPLSLDCGRGLTQREINRRERELEDLELKAELKAEVARVLWMLAKDNPKTSKSLTETKALLCFATLMEKGKGAVQLNSVKAVTEIAVVAETDVDIRRAAFKMTSPAARAVVEQLLRLVEEGEPELQVSCIKAIGCLSRTFPARETRVVNPLVKELEGIDTVVAAEAVMALEKFACTDNFLHMEHCRAIIEASGATHLVQMIYFGKGQAQISAVTLMCYLALHAEDSEVLAKAEPLPALKGFAKNASLGQRPSLEKLLTQSITHLEIFQAKSVRNHYNHGCDKHT